MDKSEQIKLTFDNVKSLYEQVSELLKIIEDHITYERFNRKKYQSIGGKTCTWEGSTSLDNPDRWYSKFFIRYYVNQGSKPQNASSAIGIGVWSHGDLGTEMVSVKPYISCSIIDFPKSHGNNIREWVRKAGQNTGYHFSRENEKSLLYSSKYTDDESCEKEFTSMKVFFLELTKVTNEDKIKELIITPLKALISEKDHLFLEEKGYLPITT